MARPSHQLNRAVSGLAVRAVRGSEQRKRMDAEMGFQEVEEQWQIEVSGTSIAAVTTTDVTIEFEHAFAYAPGNRDSDLVEPHLSVGGFADNTVFFAATVKEWDVDADNDTIIGAVVRIGAFGGTGLAYKGRVHLTFQGWGSVRDGESAAS